MSKISHDSDVPAQGQQVLTAVAFIHKEVAGITKVFLPKRAATKKFLPSEYELPGGHVDFGEKLVDGLKRELLEEFDMNISVGDPFACFTYVNEVKGSHSIEVIYFAKFTDPIDDIKLDPQDHETYSWFAENELEDAYSQNKSEHDAEFVAIRKGFSLLKGDSLNFG